MLKRIIYQDTRGEWRWSLLAGNNHTIADSSEGYTRKSGAKRAFSRMEASLQYGKPIVKLEA